MNDNALAVYGLTKRYPDFLLDKVSFCVPSGTIVGLIGENGAGKSTTIKAILDLIKKDAGIIELLGKREQEIDFDTRNRVGVVFDNNNFPGSMTPSSLGKLMESVYPLWDKNQYDHLLKKLSLPSLPLYWGIFGLFFLFSALIQKGVIVVGVSVAASILLVVFTNKLYNGTSSLLRYSPIIQIGEIANGTVSNFYVGSILLSIGILAACVLGSILKFNHTEL